MKSQGDVAHKSYSQDGQSYDQAQARPYVGTIQEAQLLAELGALALTGDSKSHQRLLAEIERLKQIPKLFNVVAKDLVRISITKDGLPVHARVDRDESGNVVSLRFDSRDELEKVVRRSAYKYSERMAENGMSPAVGVPDEGIMQQAALLDVKEFDATNVLKDCEDFGTADALETAGPAGAEASRQSVVKPNVDRVFLFHP